jgi:hypothetical protein
MTIKISGDNSTSSPAIQGSDPDSGLRVDGNNIDNVIDGLQRLRIDGAGIQILRNAESFSQIRRTGTVGDDDYIGAFSWRAENSGGNQQYEYAKLNVQIKDVTSGTENARMIFEHKNDGNMHSAFELENGVHSFPRLPYCTGGQNGGWVSFQASPAADYGILPSNGTFFTNSNAGFYAGSAINGYKVIHAAHPGVYLFILTLYRNLGFDARVNLRRNNSHEFGFIETQGSQQNDHTLSMTCIETLAAGDYVNLRFSGSNGGSLYTGDNHTTLSIVKIG